MPGLSVLSISLANRDYRREERERRQRLYLRVFEPLEPESHADSSHVSVLLTSQHPHDTCTTLAVRLVLPSDEKTIESLINRTISANPPASILADDDCDRPDLSVDPSSATRLMISGRIAYDQEEGSSKPGPISVPLLAPAYDMVHSARAWIESMLDGHGHFTPAMDEEVHQAIGAKRAKLFRPSWYSASSHTSSHVPMDRLALVLKLESAEKAFTRCRVKASWFDAKFEVNEWLPSAPFHSYWAARLMRSPTLEAMARLNPGDACKVPGSCYICGGTHADGGECSVSHCLAPLGSARQRADRLRKLVSFLSVPGAIGDAEELDTRTWLAEAIEQDSVGAGDFPPITVMLMSPEHSSLTQRKPVDLDSLLAGVPPALAAPPHEIVTGLERTLLSARVPQLVSSVMRGMGPRVGALRVPSEASMVAKEKEISLYSHGRALSMHLLPSRTNQDNPHDQGGSASKASCPFTARPAPITKVFGISPAQLAAYRTRCRPSMHDWQPHEPADVCRGPRNVLRSSMCNGLPSLLRWEPVTVVERPYSVTKKRAAEAEAFADPPARRRASDVLSWLNNPKWAVTSGSTRRGLAPPDSKTSIGHEETACSVRSSPGLGASPERISGTDKLLSAHSPRTSPRGGIVRQALQPTGTRSMGLRAAELTSSQRPGSRIHSNLDDTMQESVDAYFAARRGGANGRTTRVDTSMFISEPPSIAVGVAVPSAEPSAEPLVVKLERAARRGSLLALLPESTSRSLPMLAAQLLHALVPNEHASALWLLPGDVVPAAVHFWQCLGPSHITLRTLSAPPGVGSEPLIERGHVGILSLADISSTAVACTTSLVILTLSPPDLAGCRAVGSYVCNERNATASSGASPNLVALICGLPSEADSLIPMCRALGVPHMYLRTDADADVVVLSRQLRVHGFHFPHKLAQTCEELWQMCQRLLAEAQQRNGHLSHVRLVSASLSDAIESLPRGGDPKTFQQLMACLCARKALDFMSWTDATGLRSHLDACVRSLKHSSACRSHGPIAQLLSERQQAETVVSAVHAAKERALREILEEAIADGFGSSREGLHGGTASVLRTGPSPNGDARHGVVLVAQSRLLSSVSAACRAVLSDVEVDGDSGGHAARAEVRHRAPHPLGVQVATVDAQIETQHVLNLLKRARQLAGGGGGSGTLLFLMSHEKFHSFERFPWSAFRLYVEYDAPATPLHFAAQLQQPAIAIYLLQPQPGDDSRTAQQHAHQLDCTGSDFEASLSEPPEVAVAFSVATPSGTNSHMDAMPAAAGGERGGALSAFDEAVRLLRAAQGVRYDDAIHLGALQRQRPPEMEQPTARHTIRTDDNGMQAISWPLMVGEALLDAPKLYSLLRSKGVKLIETSAQLPHLILGAGAGLLACDESALADPTAMVTAVRMCERISLHDLWLLVLVDDDSDEHPESGSRRMTQDSSNAVSASQGASTEAVLWKQVGRLLARTSGSPVRLCVRVSSWRHAWHSLQRIMIAHRPSSSEWPCNPGALDEETEHERLLLGCGLSPWAARKVVQEYTLRSFLSLPPTVRMSHFPWLSERVLRQLVELDDDAVKDGAAASARGEKEHGDAVRKLHTGRLDESGLSERRSAQRAPTCSMASGGAEAAARVRRQEEEQHRRNLGYAEDAAAAWQASHPCWNAEVPATEQQERHSASASHGHSFGAHTRQWGAEHNGHVQAGAHYHEAGFTGQDAWRSSQKKRQAPDVQHQAWRRVHKR